MHRFSPKTAALVFPLAPMVLGLLIASCGTSGGKKPVDEPPIIETRQGLDSASAKAGNLLVVLDLYADWCGPCRILAPRLQELSQENKDKAAFYRVNVDNSQDLARSFGVRGIPYVIFLKNGKPVYALTGLNPKENYQKVLTTCDGARTADECVDRLNNAANR